VNIVSGAAPVAPAAQPLSFEELYTSPQNKVFKVVFFPDRIFHAQYLNASRVPHRYRYAVTEVRNILDITVLKARLFMDGQFATNLLRIEYRGSRLMELARESGRFMRERLIAWVSLNIKNEDGEKETIAAPVKLQYCPWIDAYQVEIWQTLEPPSRSMRHDFQIMAQMGPLAPINRVRKFSNALRDLNSIIEVELAFREDDVYEPYGRPIDNPRWDNNFERSYQAPNSPTPNQHDQNTILVNNYLLSFQKGWFIDSNEVRPVRYRNAMMDDSNRDFVPPNRHPQWNDPAVWSGPVPARAFAEANVIEMKWLLQRELGGSMVFFHEVTIPPGTVEGAHQHIGSEELYYIVSGSGVAYMSAGDDPATDGFPRVKRDIYGLFETECVELPIGPGHVIFTKGGGMHGIKNTGNQPLKFVAFLYHST
jgi:mannose-6-phosphate isomerase-like protein (cupin superfamily)